MGRPAEDFPLVGSYNNQRVAEIDSERSVNCFEYIDPQGKKPKSLIGTSGLIVPSFVFTGASGPCRKQFVFLGDQYIVFGQDLYQISPSNVVTKITSPGNQFNTATGYMGVDGNTFQLIFTDTGNGYVYDTTTNLFTVITDPAFPLIPVDMAVLDEFAATGIGGTNEFLLSMLDQALVWGPDNSGSLATFTMAATSSNIVISYPAGVSIANYQVGVPIIFSGGSLPVELTAGKIYYVKSHVNSTTITVSATNGGTAITSVLGGSGSLTNNGQLQQGAITTHSGTVVALRTLHRRLFIFSQFFIEPWENAGLGTNLPFRRNNAALIEYGSPAIGSISVSFDRMFFLSQTRDGIGPFMEVQGVQAIPVSTRALNNQLAIYSALGQVADCTGFMIQENGLIFYRANFTAANHTFVYNVSLSNPTGDDPEKRWHEEEDLHGNRHWTNTHAYFNGINYSGDYRLPVIYQVSGLAFSNNGENIPRMRISAPQMNPGSCRRRVDRLFIDMQQGQVGIDTLPSRPYVYLSISKDGGQSYGYTVKLPYSAVGNRTFRTIARKLGVIPRGQAFVCKVQFYAQTRFVILGSSWVNEILPE